MARKRQELAVPGDTPAGPDGADDATRPMIGEAIIESALGNVEADMRRSLAAHNLRQAKARMEKIRLDCEEAVAQVVASPSEEQAELTSLYLESVRGEMIALFLTVNHQAASTAEGRSRIAAIANRVVDGYVGRLYPLACAGAG